VTHVHVRYMSSPVRLSVVCLYITFMHPTHPKLLLITNRKSHVNLRLVPNWVTLDDLERRNSSNRSVISPNSVAFGADYVKVTEDTPILSAEAKCRPNNQVFSDISLTALLAGDHP